MSNGFSGAGEVVVYIHAFTTVFWPVIYLNILRKLRSSVAASQGTQYCSDCRLLLL